MRQLIEEPVGSEATRLVTGERQANYGDPLKNYEKLALMVSAVVGTTVDRRQAMQIMICCKLCRDVNKPLRDNEVDICGYAHLLQMDREDRNGNSAR